MRSRNPFITSVSAILLAGGMSGQPVTPPEKAFDLPPVRVTATPEMQSNTIDRKVYKVGQDVQSATGSASDLLRNIPSVGFDLDGNISLRNSSDVQILVDGKPMAMGSSPADALERMQASNIERIEVITNPSAKYKPDGGAGIINIVRTRTAEEGGTGTLRATIGNERRGKASVSASYKRGPSTLFGDLGIRQAQFENDISDKRTLLDGAGRTLLTMEETMHNQARPFIREGGLGFNYELSKQTQFGAEARYEHSQRQRNGTEFRQGIGSDGLLFVDEHRLWSGPQVERQFEFRSHWTRTFGPHGHALALEFQHGWDDEKTAGNFSDVAAPSSVFRSTTYGLERVKTEFSADYVKPMAQGGKLETGYAWSSDRAQTAQGFHEIDPISDQWVADPARNHRFDADQGIHALYLTYGRNFGALGVLMGLRGEVTETGIESAAAELAGDNRYARLYPSLHLSWDLNERQQLQLSYSHRVQRPKPRQLNPFPDSRDPYNVHVGNPSLVPEDIHSFEAGWQYKAEQTTYLAALYYRDERNGITETTELTEAGTLVTTLGNLSSSRSGGLELVANTRSPGRRVALDLNANLFYSEIDAGNLGFATPRSTVTWDAKLGLQLQPSKRDLVQLDAKYSARSLTPQGERSPGFVLNVGIKHEMKNGKSAFVLTVSDLLGSAEERTLINTPTVQRERTHRRATPVIYAGFTYRFGGGTRNDDGSGLEFEAPSGN